MSETRYVWVHYGDPYDSRWHACTTLRRLPDGRLEVELERSAPPVSGYIGLDGLGGWPGPGLQVDLRNFAWVPFPARVGHRQEEQPEVGTRTITVPAALVHAQRGDISTGWHSDYPPVAVQRARTWRTRVGQRLRELLGGAA